MMNKEKKKGKEGFFKCVMNEIRDSILSELVFNILTLIPRMIVRLVKSLF
ncbi:hypothetical protein SAMN05878482_106247 [Peribacillus simplex]|uniref:Uncharacterized protein n=1 Tax=Peribacillus simplex TaxID=1478 RepID=A0A9X8WM55_9BACI|nr:hypothetical protein [Peribacillus simplex]SIR86293.1 hypothetical protein SAMN05878482_106247 [Peribacillus simplex]